jgi:catechol 2,3-dioxygenase-like lactoylglutathione lyase family enzyme
LVGCLRRRLRRVLDSDYDLRLRQIVVSGLDLLFLEVNSLEESLLFYQERLGFEIVSRNLAAEPPIATVGAGSLRITLVQQLETMLKRGRGVHFVLGVSNVDEFHEKLTASGVEVTEPKDEGWGGRFISLQDPDGYRLFFVTWEK